MATKRNFFMALYLNKKDEGKDFGKLYKFFKYFVLLCIIETSRIGCFSSHIASENYKRFKKVQYCHRQNSCTGFFQFAGLQNEQFEHKPIVKFLKQFKN